MIRTFEIVLFAALVGGCAHLGTPPTTTPVCEALIGPIKYNSTNPASPRHAGKALAPDLAQRNRVGKNLRCPQYK